MKSRVFIAAAVTIVIGATLLAMFALTPWLTPAQSEVAAEPTLVPTTGTADGSVGQLQARVDGSASDLTARADPPAQVEQPGAPTPRTITVVADGVVKVHPDIAYISLGVQTLGKTAQEATAGNAARMNDILTKLGQLGVAKEDIQTSGLSLFPESEPSQPDAMEVTRYRVFNNVTVRVTDVAKAADLIDGAVAAGANSMASINFAVQDDSAARLTAVREAVKAARPKAEAIAAELGVTIKSVTLVEEQGGEFGYPLTGKAYGGMGAGPAASTPLSPGEISVGATVRVTYSY